MFWYVTLSSYSSHIYDTSYLFSHFFQSSAYLQLFNDKVQIIPAGVSKQARVEGERDDRGVRLRALPGEVVGAPLAQLHKAGDYDDDQGKHFGVREVVLYLDKQEVSFSNMWQ